MDTNSPNNKPILDTILDNADTISAAISVFNPAAGLLTKLATSTFKALNNSDDDNLKEYYGLEQIAKTIEDVSSGKIDKSELLNIALQIREIKKALSKFNNLIS